MLKGGNHEAAPLTTHGFLIGIELENGVNVDLVMARLIDSVGFIEGVGHVEAEHIGAMGDYKSLEEEVLDAITTSIDVPIVES